MTGPTPSPQQQRETQMIERIGRAIRAVLSIAAGMFMLLVGTGTYAWHKYAHADVPIEHKDLWFATLLVFVGVTLVAGQAIVAFLLDRLTTAMYKAIGAWRGDRRSGEERRIDPPDGGV